MKKFLSAFVLFATLLFTACVQPVHRKTVIYTLTLTDSTHTSNVGIRGGDKPLQWENDTLLSPVIPDAVYRIAITYITGYTFTEVKFTKDGEFELIDQPNRKIQFSTGDTTYVNATFNQN